MTAQALRRLTGLILLLGSCAAAAAILTVPPVGAADTRQARCGPTNAKTIVANDRIRVYKEATDEDGVEGGVVACLAGTSVSRDLESQRDTYYVFRPPALQLRGTMIATAKDFCDSESGCETSIAVQDLARTGREQLLNSHIGGPRGRRLIKVGSLRFRPSGSVAWIACIEPSPEVFVASRQPNCVRPGRGRKWVMRKRIGSSKADVLDSGHQIDPNSLRLAGSRLTWKKDGDRRVRQLP